VKPACGNHLANTRLDYCTVLHPLAEPGDQQRNQEEEQEQDHQAYEDQFPLGTGQSMFELPDFPLGHLPVRLVLLPPRFLLRAEPLKLYVVLRIGAIDHGDISFRRAKPATLVIEHLNEQLFEPL
jgi:hypothetical protein